MSPRRRVDKALYAVICQAWIDGVSTRKVDHLIKALGNDTGISKSIVSRICADIDEGVTQFLDRPLDHTWFPYLVLDATYLDVRVRNRVVSQKALLCLGSVDDKSNFRLSDLVVSSKLPEEISHDNPGWPSSTELSALRFASLLDATKGALWVDRYLFHRDPELVNKFLVALREHKQTPLRMLVSENRDDGAYSRTVAKALQGIDHVSVRAMTGFDKLRLHDRHLVLPSLQTGFIIPTAGVVIGRDEPGSAVAARMPALAIDYIACWKAGSEVWRSPA